jgi:predicted Fe-S protein YdhL (DUF1289 family)
VNNETSKIRNGEQLVSGPCLHGEVCTALKTTLCKPCTKYNEKNERLDWLKLYKSMYKNNLITKVATVGEM